MRGFVYTLSSQCVRRVFLQVLLPKGFFWQHNTMQMMYEVIYKALEEAGLENTYEPQDYLNFCCLGNREAEDLEGSSDVGNSTATNNSQEDCFYDLSYNTGYQISVLRLRKTRDEIMKCTLSIYVDIYFD